MKNKNRFDSNNEAMKTYNRLVEFLKNAKEIKCEWGSVKDGICQSMRVLNINYSVRIEAPNVINYFYIDNFNNSITGSIILN